MGTTMVTREDMDAWVAEKGVRYRVPTPQEDDVKRAYFDMYCGGGVNPLAAMDMHAGITVALGDIRALQQQVAHLSAAVTTVIKEVAKLKAKPAPRKRGRPAKAKTESQTSAESASA